ncbi:hypothetical protein D046_5853B, partial [Vibrio parahaemolyticus V-223/04]
CETRGSQLSALW